MVGDPDQTAQHAIASRERIEDLMRENRQLRSELRRLSIEKAETEKAYKSALESLTTLTDGQQTEDRASRRRRRRFF